MALAGKFESSVEAWRYRINIGQSASNMVGRMRSLGMERARRIFANWSDRIAAGELPTAAPPRPRGRERDVVITMWDWADAKTFVHDEVSTDKRTPTLNANGPVYGVSEFSGDWLTILDPATHTASRVLIPPHAENVQPAVAQTMPNPSPVWGDEPIWAPKVVAHNPMMDSKGRVWITARGGCRVYDPKTKQIDIAHGCEAAHHLQFAEDGDETLWSNSPAAYFRTKAWETNHDVKGSRVPLIVDVNGNGKRDEAVAANQPVDPTKDKTIRRRFCTP